MSATPESTRAFTVEALRQFYTERYTPQNTTVIVEGDISPERVFLVFTDGLKGWEKNSIEVNASTCND